MELVGLVVIGIGVVLFFVQRSQKARAACIKLARDGTVADLKKLAQEIGAEIGRGSWRDYVKINGLVTCDRPLKSELKQEPCVYYKMSVRREYEETVTLKDEKGRPYTETRRGSDVVASNSQSVPFQLQDATGTLEVNLDGAEIDTVKVLDEFRPDSDRGGFLSYGNFSLALSQSYPSSNRRTLGYRYSEAILPVERRVYILAEVSDELPDLILQKPSAADRHFLVSLKSPDELASSADRNAQYAFYGMVGCLIGGPILAIAGLIF